MATTYDDYIRKSFLPAANAYYGSTLDPIPNRGTYYRPEMYRGFTGNINRVQRSLANAYQSDLAFNAAANPRQSQELRTEANLARTGGSMFDPRTGEGFTSAGYKRPKNLITYTLPGGGTVALPATSKRPSIATGVVGQERFSPQQSYNLGFYGQPTAPPTTQFARNYQTGFTGGREGAGVTIPQPQTGSEFNVAGIPFGLPSAQQLSSGASTFGRYLAGLFKPRDYFATQ